MGSVVEQDDAAAKSERVMTMDMVQRVARAEADLARARRYGDAVWIEAAEKELWAVKEVAAAEGQGMTRFAVGDRCFSHYTMRWGTIERIDHEGTQQDGETYTTWYVVRSDDNSLDLLDDAHGNWEMARVVPPQIAKRYGYGDDPQVQS